MATGLLIGCRHAGAQIRDDDQKAGWMNMIERRIDEFLDDLASKKPTPGGGGAAALMGAMGAALVSMVCRLTLGKKAYESAEPEMRSTLELAEHLRTELTSLVRCDVEVFDRVMSAYRLPKDTAAAAEARNAAIQEALKAATEVPMDCARRCAEVIRLSRIVAQRGNRNVVSDAGVAVSAALAGMQSAALNVAINTGSVQDEAFVETRVAEIEHLLAEGDAAAREIVQVVKSKL